MKMYKVWNEKKCEWMYVDDEWMEGVNTKNVKEFNFFGVIERLEVIYKDGHTVYYENVHGTWGFPIEFLEVPSRI